MALLPRLPTADLLPFVTTKAFSYDFFTNSRRDVLFGSGLFLYDLSTNSRKTPVEKTGVPRLLHRDGDEVTGETEVKRTSRNPKSLRHPILRVKPR